MGGYWNAHSDRDFEDRNNEPEPDEGEWREIEIDGLLEEVRCLKATIARMQGDLDAAEKWARDYETAHGPFQSEPPIPVFMISF